MRSRHGVRIRRNTSVRLHWTQIALPLEHKSEVVLILSFCRFASKQVNCCEGRKFSLHLLQRTQKKPVSTAARKITGLVHPAELPGIWKKNLHAIRRARTRLMGKHGESWGLLQQWCRPTENFMVATLQRCSPSQFCFGQCTQQCQNDFQKTMGCRWG